MNLAVSEFLKNKQNNLLIDVRTPAEFEKGHIPGAFNIPLFTNEERAEVGTLYKNMGKEPAILRALELTGPKLAKFLLQLKEIHVNNNEIFVHCWRGGMRSSSMAWLFSLNGYNVHTLQNGYKAYRNHILNLFENASNLLVIGGLTGSGKTEILKHLISEFQVSDLEHFACHKGSAFGFIGEKPQPTTEQFENDLGEEWMKFDLNKTIIVEDESRTIGKVYLPDILYSRIRSSENVFINMPKKLRIKRLVNDYASFDKELLKIAVDKILNKLGGQNHKEAVLALENNDFEKVADISLLYYDKTYLYGLNKRDQTKVFKIDVETDDAAENASRIIELIKKSSGIKII
jgi:tRNA 2-selenouridine synthase